MALSEFLEDSFLKDSADHKSSVLVNKGLKFDSRYKDEYPDPGIGLDPSLSSTEDLVRHLESTSDEIDAAVWAVGPAGPKLVRMAKKEFIEAFRSEKPRLKEGVDWFAADYYPSTKVGVDYVPLLGGPFFRQQYIYDMLKGHQQAFFAYHHDPFCRQAVNIINDFTLGKGFRADCDDPTGQILWDAFAKTNFLDQFMRYVNTEMTLFGEALVWTLPDLESSFRHNVPAEQAAQRGLLPRVRLIDPSTCWEIVTYPEDLTPGGVLHYQLVYPTQYQMYTGQDKGKQVPSTKYIFRQVPAPQVKHYKINVVSDEKRGRSEFYPVFGYLKRLRDAINFNIMGLMKASAWSIDTTIDGSQADIDAYQAAVQSLGDYPPPGSEFIHSNKVKREYLSSDGSGARKSEAFEWVLSCICSGLGIPLQYFCTHLTSGSSRAGAIVATEPVAKKFEMRQEILKTVLQNMADDLFELYNIKCSIEFTFPEIITQDRSAKLKDLSLAAAEGWISSQRAAEIASQELGIKDFDFELERAQIEKEKLQGIIPAQAAPLTTPAGFMNMPPSEELSVRQTSE
jgi:hypothetical protein